MQKLFVDYVVPGHGEVGGKEVFQEMYDNVTIWTETVKDAIKHGMTVEEAQQKLDMAKKFPNLPKEPRTADIIRMNIGAIYMYYKK
jgi:hypothetical protein